MREVNRAYRCATPRMVGTLQTESPFTGRGIDVAMPDYTGDLEFISTPDGASRVTGLPSPSALDAALGLMFGIRCAH